jgi:hypothetical protein
MLQVLIASRPFVDEFLPPGKRGNLGQGLHEVAANAYGETSMLLRRPSTACLTELVKAQSSISTLTTPVYLPSWCVLMADMIIFVGTCSAQVYPSRCTQYAVVCTL